LGGRSSHRSEGESDRGRCDTTSLRKGPHQGAIGWNWQTDLNDRVRRDIADPRTFAQLCSRYGIAPDDTVVFYGDNNNWFAAWALCSSSTHGHKDVRLMNGGRKKWELEKRALVTDARRHKRAATPRQRRTNRCALIARSRIDARDENDKPGGRALAG
jgi:3-mercaptopyruvate sulfurtransferase SseA